MSALVDPLLRGQLPPADLAEAHRLAGLAAFFQQRPADAEAHFLAYLRLELDARLDPTLYTPDVVNFFEDVKSRNQAELRARRPKPRRYWLLNLVPPLGQLQNGERTKGIVLGAMLGGFAVGGVSSYLALRSWCTHTSGPSGASYTCDGDGTGKDRARTAGIMRGVAMVSGVGFALTYAYGVYDGASGYRRRTVTPFIAPGADGGVVGVAGSF